VVVRKDLPVSPVLANLFLHYAFDAWMAREFPGVPFERYVDDAVVHCVSKHQARTVLAAIGDRMELVGLRLHPDKTRIVYCQDGQRRGSGEHTSFTVLGYEFRQRAARNKTGGPRDAHSRGRDPVADRPGPSAVRVTLDDVENHWLIAGFDPV
jgi:hypothetical protein